MSAIYGPGDMSNPHLRSHVRCWSRARCVLGLHVGREDRLAILLANGHVGDDAEEECGDACANGDACDGARREAVVVVVRRARVDTWSRAVVVVDQTGVPQATDVSACDAEARVVALKGRFDRRVAGGRGALLHVVIHDGRVGGGAGMESREHRSGEGVALSLLLLEAAELVDLVGVAHGALDERDAHQVRRPLDNRPHVVALAELQLELAEGELPRKVLVHLGLARGLVARRPASLVVHAPLVGERPE
mmetsp:Transcript_33904/g.112157  ORF Transcript_33904/g.112157 Transcript_33904/m.112157 type:complete len:249 (-) Transcript_33904:994-1740(-)